MAVVISITIHEEGGEAQGKIMAQHVFPDRRAAGEALVDLARRLRDVVDPADDVFAEPDPPPGA